MSSSRHSHLLEIVKTDVPWLVVGRLNMDGTPAGIFLHSTQELMHEEGAGLAKLLYNVCSKHFQTRAQTHPNCLLQHCS